MKKILLFLLTILSVSTSFSQDGNDLKRFRFGLKIAPSFDWYSVDNKKKFESEGARAKFGWGFTCEYNLSNNASLISGLEITYSGGKISFSDTSIYNFNSVEEEIVLLNKDGQIKDPADTVNLVQNRLLTRTYNGSYVTLPLAIKMKTNEIGMFTYYGIFGFTAALKTRGKADDEIIGSNNLLSTVPSLNVNKELQPIMIALNIGAGLEFNFSGTTSLFAGVSYNNGFSNVVKKTSTHLLESSGTVVKQRFLARGISIHIGFLF